MNPSAWAGPDWSNGEFGEINCIFITNYGELLDGLILILQTMGSWARRKVATVTLYQPPIRACPPPRAQWPGRSLQATVNMAADPGLNPAR